MTHRPSPLSNNPRIRERQEAIHKFKMSEVMHYLAWTTDDGEWKEIYVCRQCGARYGDILACPCPGPCRACGKFQGHAHEWLTTAGRQTRFTRRYLLWGFIPWRRRWRRLELKHEYQARMEQERE